MSHWPLQPWIGQDTDWGGAWPPDSVRVGEGWRPQRLKGRLLVMAWEEKQDHHKAAVFSCQCFNQVFFLLVSLLKQVPWRGGIKLSN